MNNSLIWRFEIQLDQLKRIQFEAILNDLNKKMVILYGPRQVGKTFPESADSQNLSKSFVPFKKKYQFQFRQVVRYLKTPRTNEGVSIESGVGFLRKSLITNKV